MSTIEQWSKIRNYFKLTAGLLGIIYIFGADISKTVKQIRMCTKHFEMDGYYENTVYYLCIRDDGTPPLLLRASP